MTSAEDRKEGGEGVMSPTDPDEFHIIQNILVQAKKLKLNEHTTIKQPIMGFIRSEENGVNMTKTCSTGTNLSN